MFLPLIFSILVLKVLQDCLMQIKEIDAPRDRNGDDSTDEMEEEERKLNKS